MLVNAACHGDGTGGTVDWTVPGRAESYAAHLLDRLAERGSTCEGGSPGWRPGPRPISSGPPPRPVGPSTARPATAPCGLPTTRQPFTHPRLFLVGGSAHPGGGLPLVGMGAETVAALIGR